MKRSILAVALVFGSFVSVASAQEEAAAEQGPTHVLRVSKLYSFGGGASLDHGFGLDLRYRAYPENDLDGYVGVYANSQYELADAWRFSGGITGGWAFFGLEVGISHRTATRDFAGSTGLQIGQSFTFGPVSIGARLTIPLVDHLEQNMAVVPNVQGIEGALTVSLGWDFTLAGRNRSCCHCRHGHGH
jgi:hypothetical protein